MSRSPLIAFSVVVFSLALGCVPPEVPPGIGGGGAGAGASGGEGGSGGLQGGTGGSGGGGGSQPGPGGSGGSGGAGGQGGGGGSGGAGGSGGIAVEELFPAELQIGTGERQRFLLPYGDEGQWKASCGTIEISSTDHAIWKAPNEPASCMIEFFGEALEASAEARVVEPTPTISRLEGLGGFAAVPSLLVAGKDGHLWTNGYRSLVGLAPGQTTWTVDLGLPRIDVRALVASPTGALHLLSQAGMEVEWYSLREDSSEWEAMPSPPAPALGFWKGAAASPDGRFCFGSFLSQDFGVLCADPEGSWSTIAQAPAGQDIAALAFTSDNRLVLATGLGIYEYVDEEPQPIVEGAYRIGGFLVVGEAIFAYGEGVFYRASAEDPMTDVSEGLPTGCFTLTGRCPISGLAELGGELYAIAAEGLYRWRMEGEEGFERLADLPPHENVGSFFGNIIARGDDLLVPTSRGIWRFQEATKDWELVSRGGVDFGRRALAMDFLPDGTEVWAAGSFRSDFNHLYRRSEGDLHWTKMESDDPLPLYHDVQDLALRKDGALLVGTERLNSGAGDRGLLFFAEPGSDTYEKLGLEGLPVWNPLEDRTSLNLVAVAWMDDGSALVALDAKGLFRLAPGATTWVPFGPEVEVDDMLVHGDGRILVASATQVLSLSSDQSEWEVEYEVPFSARILGLSLDEGGTLWLATEAGAYVAKEGELVSAGTGDCSVYAQAIFAGAGRAYCHAEQGFLAELREGQWIRIPGLAPGEHSVEPVTAGPEGSLYLLFGVSTHTALVRTLP